MNTTKEEIKKIMDYYKEEYNAKFLSHDIRYIIFAIALYLRYIQNLPNPNYYLNFLQFMLAIYGIVAMSYYEKYSSWSKYKINGESLVVHPKANYYLFYSSVLIFFSLIIACLKEPRLYVYFITYVALIFTTIYLFNLLFGLYPKFYFKYHLINYLAQALSVLLISLFIPYVVYLYISFDDAWYIKLIMFGLVIWLVSIGLRFLSLNNTSLKLYGFNFFQMSSLGSNTKSEILKIMLHDEEVVKIKNDLYQKLEEWFPEDDKYKERVLLEVLANRYKKPNNKLLFILGSAIGFIILEIRSKVFDEYIYTPHIKEWIQNIF